MLAENISTSDALEQMERLMDGHSRRYDVLAGINKVISPSMPFMAGWVFTYEFEHGEIKTLESSASMLTQACIMLAKPKELEKGYSIVFKTWFEYSKREVFDGLFLTLLDPSKQVVGVLEFKIGVPFEVNCIQGKGSGLVGENRAQKFYNETGKTYYEALLNHLIYCVGANLRFDGIEKLHRPSKIDFSLDAKLNEKVAHGLAKYIRKSERLDFVEGKSEVFAKRRVGHIRPEFFSPPWRAEHGKINLPPAKKPMTL